MYHFDNRIVITLDAGGTNLVFGAMRGCEFIVEPVTIPSRADNLDLCLQAMVNGFKTIIDLLDEKPVAISFAFPGPADYPNGIVGGYLPNFPSFRDGVALGPFLEEKFGLPVFINNDGDLFAFGEATAGALPEINNRVAELGSKKQYRNILGYTFGTGFGIGEVIDGKLNLGNNACIETFCLPSKSNHDVMVEDSVAIRAVIREYLRLSESGETGLTPKDICDIADGTREGDRDAAIESFRLFGEAAGDAMATAVTLTDSLIVIGGGLTGAARYIMPSLLRELRSRMFQLDGGILNRVQMKVYDLDDEAEFAEFARGESRSIKVYGSDREVVYDPQKRIGVMISKIGASTAISLGAYAFALNDIDKRQGK